MKGTLVVSSVKQTIYPSKTLLERSWRQFLAGGTSHSAGANILPYIMNRCEREGRPYELLAHPGEGYYIRPITEFPKNA